MKNIVIKITLALSIVFSIQSCNDALDITPVDESTGQIESLTDYRTFRNGAIDQYQNFNLIGLNSWVTDEVRLGNDNGGQNVEYLQHTWNANAVAVNGLFRNSYEGILFCNRIINTYDAADLSSFSAIERAELQDIRGQAQFMRALHHFSLMAMFTEDLENPTSLAVPYVNRAIEPFEQLPRNTVQELTDSINRDLNEAESLITGLDPAYPTRDAVKALRARLALYTGDFGTAISESQDLIDSYPLANTAQYIDMYKDADQTEVIFSIVEANQNEDDFIGGVWFFTGTGGATFEVGESLYNLTDASDVRQQIIVDLVDDADIPVDVASSPPTTIFVGKYQGKGGIFALNNVKVFRVAEQYLINAEAHARNTSPNLSEATNKVVQLRAARALGTPPSSSTYSSTIEAVTDIVRERRLELAFEGHRLLDAKRTRGLIGSGIQRIGNDCASAAVPCTLVDFRYTMPIPQAEINVNPNMVQNTGY